MYPIFRPISPLLDVLEESTSHLGHFAWPFDCPCSSSGAADALQYLKAGTSLGGYEDSINSEGPTRWVCWLNTKIWQVIGWLAARSNRCRMCVCVCVCLKKGIPPLYGHWIWGNVMRCDEWIWLASGFGVRFSTKPIVQVNMNGAITANGKATDPVLAVSVRKCRWPCMCPYEMGLSQSVIQQKKRNPCNYL